MSPLPNEHSCRLKPSGGFDRFARKNCDQKHNGKCIDVTFGIKGSTSEIQSLRYSKSIWSAEAARSHCKGRGGSFEAALEDFSPKVVRLRLPEDLKIIDAQWLSRLSNDELIRLHNEVESDSDFLSFYPLILKELEDRGLRQPEANLNQEASLFRFLGPLRGTVVENIVESIRRLRSVE